MSERRNKYTQSCTRKGGWEEKVGKACRCLLCRLKRSRDNAVRSVEQRLSAFTASTLQNYLTATGVMLVVIYRKSSVLLWGVSEPDSNGLTAELVASILSFFAELCCEPSIRDWLGTAEGNVFWPALLTMLCNTSTQRPALSTLPVPHRHKVSGHRPACQCTFRVCLGRSE